MTDLREELCEKIEAVRSKLNSSIDRGDKYEIIYQYSIELDELLNQYVVLES